MTLPSGTVVTLNYSDEYKSNEASRVAKLVISETTVARYEYLGASQVVGTDYPQPDVFSRVFDPSTETTTIWTASTESRRTAGRRI